MIIGRLNSWGSSRLVRSIPRVKMLMFHTTVNNLDCFISSLNFIDKKTKLRQKASNTLLELPWQLPKKRCITKTAFPRFLYLALFFR